MGPEESRSGDSRAAAKGAAGDLFELIRAYVVQETVGPLRGIVRRLLFGAAGGLLLGTGLVLLLMAVLRALQTETGTFFAGNMSFGPYLATFVIGLAVLGAAVLVLLRAIGKGARSGRR